MTNTTHTFETGKIYTMSFIGDSDLKPEFKCIKRTAKTATFEAVKGSETLTRRIKEHGGSEYILQGTYSMAPCIKASRIVVS